MVMASTTICHRRFFLVYSLRFQPPPMLSAVARLSANRNLSRSSLFWRPKQPMSTLTLSPPPTIPSVNFGVLSDILQGGIWLIKRTFQPSIVRRKRKGGFLVRQRTVGGRRTLRRRRLKSRWRLGI